MHRCQPLLAFFKCILEVTLCEDVQHRLRFCLNQHSCVKMAAFQPYLQFGKQTKVRWVGTRVVLVLVKNSLVKEEVRERALSLCNTRFFVAKVWDEVFSHFHAVAIKSQSMRN
jgi:hypothetical protein